MKRNNITMVLIFLVSIFLLMACQSAEKDQGMPPSNQAAINTPNGTEDNSQEGWKNLQIHTTDLKGTQITGEDFLQNKLTILNVWGTWCPPCVGELPELQKVSEAFANQGVQIVGVLQDGVTEEGVPDETIIKNALTLLEDAGANYMVILPDEILMAKFISQMQYFPTTFFIDGEGMIIHTVIGAKDFEAWSDEIEEVLSEISL